jgi:hypothetical protein
MTAIGKSGQSGFLRKLSGIHQESAAEIDQNMHHAVDNRVNGMKNAHVLRVVVPTWGTLVLVIAISLTGCVSNYSYTQVSPSEAASALHAGDAVEITRKDDSVIYLKIKEIDDTEVFGSDQTSMFGRIKKTIPLDDIASISLSRKEGYDANQTIEAWSYLLILWPFFVF